MSTKTEYLSGFQYKNEVLKFFSHAEGYVNYIPASGKGTVEAFNYAFNYTDHLGNIRLTYGIDPTTNVLKIMEENHYYPFGLKHTNYNTQYNVFSRNEEDQVRIAYVPPAESFYKLKYNGKELQDELGLNFYDYGARNYDPVLGRWMNIDPLAENSRRWTPYNYAYNNPMYFVDPDGMQASPIYDPKGNFLGTDENGLKGDAVVMNKEDFSQGMSREDAESKNIGQEGFKDDKALNKAYNHFTGLKDRPDYDGYLTLSEANDWYRNGNGEPLFVDAAKIDLSPVETGDFESVGSSMYKNFFLSTNQNTGRVYGTIRLTLDNADGTTTLGGNGGFLDTYNFEQKKSDGTFKRDLRNIGTKVGEILAGSGKQYNIFNYGKGKVKQTQN